MILLDFVAEKGGMRIAARGQLGHRCCGSACAPRRARSARSRRSRTRPPSAIVDDHTPFVRRGVPAIDLIDFTFDCWHKPCDDMTAVSARALDLTGETVVQMLLDLSR